MSSLAIRLYLFLGIKMNSLSVSPTRHSPSHTNTIKREPKITDEHHWNTKDIKYKFNSESMILIIIQSAPSDILPPTPDSGLRWVASLFHNLTKEISCLRLVSHCCQRKPSIWQKNLLPLSLHNLTKRKLLSLIVVGEHLKKENSLSSLSVKPHNLPKKMVVAHCFQRKPFDFSKQNSVCLQTLLWKNVNSFVQT